MRIVQYLKWMNLREGGTVRAVLDMSEAMARAGHEVTLFTADAADVPPLWQSAEPPRGTPRCVLVSLTDRVARLLGKDPAAIRRDTLTQVLDRPSMQRIDAALAGADVVHLHGVWSSTNLQIAARCRRRGVPYVVSPHGMLDDWTFAQGRFKKRIHLALFSGRYLRGAGAIHCTAHAEWDQVRRNTGLKQGVVAPLFMDLGPFQRLPGPEIAHLHFKPWPSGDVVLFLSRISPKKGVDVLVKAVAELVRAGADIHLLIAGPPDPPGYEREVLEIAQEYGVRDRCRLLGLVRGELKVSLYQAAKVMVLPTAQENFGYVLLESLAAGTPVITTRSVDIWSELEESRGATVVDREPGAVASALRQVLAEDSNAREERGQHARAWVFGKAGEAPLVEMYANLYTSAGAPRHAR